MIAAVDHKSRRVFILKHAFALFAEEGYDGVTYQKIADRCGIARTALYNYFRNKEEIFQYAIRLAAGNLNTIIERVLRQTELSPREKLTRILHITVRMLAENRIFLTVILNYVLTQKQSGKDVRRQVRRHTFGMKNLFVQLLREAAEAEELHVRQIEMVSHHLYGMLESFVLNITVTDILDTKDCLGLIDGYLALLESVAAIPAT